MMTNIDLRFRRAEKSDAAVLAEFGARTFQETFGEMNSPQDMAAYLASNYGLPQQAAELEEPNIITVVVEWEVQFVAFAQVRRQPPPGSVKVEMSVELWRFYVDRPWQGRGVAQRLMEHVHAAARELGAQIIWLGSDLQTDYLMTLEVAR